jgi:tetratricopeptide (TPR) repeat protein
MMCRMANRRRLFSLLAALPVPLAATVVHAQAAPNPGQLRGNTEIRVNEITKQFCDGRTVTITVRDDARPLDRQSVIKLHDQKRDSTMFQTTSKESEAVFCGLDFGTYDVDVSAVGYLTNHQELPIVSGSLQAVRLEVILQKDPEAVNLSTTDELIPAKARKDQAHAVEELKSAKFKEAEEHLERALKVAPDSVQINFLLGYLFLELRQWEKSESYLTRAATLSPGRVQVLTLLGRVQLQREHYADAQKTLERAVAANSAEWMTHSLLADAYLRQKQFDKAREQAQLAIDEGKSTASIAQLTLGQALANVGRDEEGIRALRAFLQSQPHNPAAPQVRALISEIETRDNGVSETSHAQGDTDLLLAGSEPALPPSAWGPPETDETKPPVAPGVTCPVQTILQMTGERIQMLVDSMARFSATEQLTHEQLDRAGNPISKEYRKFDYVVSIAEQPAGYLDVEEYRNEHYGLLDLPDHIVTSGFVTLAMIFHPIFQSDFEFNCEGLGQWKGHPAWILHFQQRGLRPNHLESYMINGQAHRVDQKGRAWISSDNLQIVRIESDLVRPVQRMTVQHQIAEYGPVHFQKKNIDLWLPQSAEIYLEINRRRYYRKHSFDHFMLFSTNAEEKPRLVKNQPAPANESELQNP